MGTPYYLSPEQARGDRDLDGRVDIWACGVVLYEALTGQRPFLAANYNALLIKILTSEPRPLRELRNSISRGTEKVVNRAMAASRYDRYPSVVAFQKDVEELLDILRPHRDQMPDSEITVQTSAFPSRHPPASGATLGAMTASESSRRGNVPSTERGEPSVILDVHSVDLMDDEEDTLVTRVPPDLDPSAVEALLQGLEPAVPPASIPPPRRNEAPPYRGKK
jgi:serine/threonine-protein kinase